MVIVFFLLYSVVFIIQVRFLLILVSQRSVIYNMKEDLFGCYPYVTVQKILSGKWAIYILYLLSEGSVRFNELQR